MFSKHIMNERLESCRSIGRPKKADLVLVVAVAAAKGSLVLIPLLDLQLVISIAQVNLGEDCGGVQAVQ